MVTVDPGEGNTYFAPAGRANAKELAAQIAAVTNHPLNNTMMESLGAVVLVVNSRRQIVATNTRMLDLCGLVDPSGILGKRPGEALQCSFAEDGPDGCGTGKTCRSCGAAVAMLASQDKNQSQEEECYLLSRQQDGTESNHEFRVRSSPLEFGPDKFLLITLLDIHAEKQRDVMVRVFFHDLMNVLFGIVGYCDVLDSLPNEEQQRCLGEISQLSRRMMTMTRVQQELHRMEMGEFAPELQITDLQSLLGSLKASFSGLELTRARSVEMPKQIEPVRFRVDASLLLRVLENMLRNALEATPEGGTVKLHYQIKEQLLTFAVWNQGEIPEPLRPRIFQRYFSTKKGAGHGLGTYSMKLIGERYLSGKVDFSSDHSGTTFTFGLSMVPPTEGTASPQGF